MTQNEDRPLEAAPRLLEGLWLKLRMAGASALFLTVGALLAPTAGPSTLTTPQERPAPLLEEQVQQRATPPPFRGVSNVADLVRSHGVTIPTAARTGPAVWSDYADAPRPTPPGGFGVFVGESFVLTHATALAGRVTVGVSTADGRNLEASVAAYDAATELTLLDIREAAASPASLANTAAPAGALGAGVVQQDGRDFVVPVFFAGLKGERYAISGTDEMNGAGLPIFNIDGELVAMAGGPETGREAIAVGPALARMLAQAAGPGQTPSLGITVQEIPRALRPRLGDLGVLVAHVVAGGPADKASLAAGEVLHAIGDVTVTGLEMMAAASESLRIGVPATLQLGRGGRRANVEATPGSTYEVASLARATRPDVQGGVPAGELISASTLFDIGLPPAALVHRIDGRPITSRAQALRDLGRARRPLSLYVYHRGQWLFVGIENAR